MLDMYQHGRCSDYRGRYERRAPLAQQLLAALEMAPISYTPPSTALVRLPHPLILS